MDNHRVQHELSTIPEDTTTTASYADAYKDLEKALPGDFTILTSGMLPAVEQIVKNLRDTPAPQSHLQVSNSGESQLESRDIQQHVLQELHQNGERSIKIGDPHPFQDPNNIIYLVMVCIMVLFFMAGAGYKVVKTCRSKKSSNQGNEGTQV